MSGLTPKQQRFVEEYMVDSNGKQAAIRCGYKPSRAERTACEMLAGWKVSEAVAAARKDKSEATGRTVLAVMADIKRIGDRAEADEDWGPALKARELEAKHLGAFVDRVQLAGGDGAPLGLRITFVAAVAVAATGADIV